MTPSEVMSNLDDPLVVNAEGCPPEVKIDVDAKKTTRIIIRIQANAVKDVTQNNSGKIQKVHIVSHSENSVVGISTQSTKDPSVSEMTKYKTTFEKLIKEKDMTFLHKLKENIQNTSLHKHAGYQLKLLADKLDDETIDENVKKNIREYINDYNVDIADNTKLLHEAAIHEDPTGDQQLIKSLLKLCPGQVTEKRTGINEGQNVLHILAFNKNSAGAKEILESCPDSSKMLSSQAICRHPKTCMMGETPLFIAALSFDKHMVDCLIDKGGVGMLRETTSQGDTVFHLLVRYAAWYPEKQQDAKDMMEKLNNILQNDEKVTKNVAIKELKNVWHTQDSDGLTVLQLAALLRQHEIYRWVLELKDIYVKYKTENLLEYVRYDISEIDSVALDWFRFPNSTWMTWRTNRDPQERKRTYNSSSANCTRPQSAPQLTYKTNGADETSFPVSRKRQRPQSAPQLTQKTKRAKEISTFPSSRKRERPQSVPQLSEQTKTTEETVTGKCQRPQSAPQLTYKSKRTLVCKTALRSPSVIEIACETKKTEDALQLIDMPLFDVIIDTKWRTYRKWFVGWFFFHLLIIGLVISQMVFKANLIRNTQQQIPASDVTVLALSIVLFMIGSILLCLELVRLIHRHPLCLSTVHHNGAYRLLLMIFSLTLMTDSIWYWITIPDNSYFLMISLLVGGWFLPFFLRPFRTFSFFTTMLRYAFLADGFRFLVIILLEYVTFSFVMYLMFLPTPGGPPAEFQNPGVAALTMFQMMIGVSDLDILTRAPYPWLSVTLFIIFILLTYMFMLNSLIAMMTSTYSEGPPNRELYCKLQTLSVVMMIESTLLFKRHACNSGDKTGNRFLSKPFYFEDKTKIAFDKMDENMLMKYKKKRNPDIMKNYSTDSNQTSKFTLCSKWRRLRTSRKTVPAETPVDKKKHIKRQRENDEHR